METLEIVPVLRFGNSVMQLVNAIYFCERTRIKKLRICGHPMIFHRELRIGDLLFFDRLNEEVEESGLAGHFFYWSRLVRFVDAPTIDDQREIAMTILRRLFTGRLFSPSIDVLPSDLVLHFRAGDVFSEDIPYNPEVRRTYLQPPFAFYKAAIEHEREKGELGRVIAVYEDLGNPCVLAIEDYCNKSGISLVKQSGQLVEDLSVLIAARKLVWSYGSFLWGAGLLSRELERSYWFEDNDYANQLARVLNLDGYACRDTNGGFLKRGEWHNTPENRTMMTEYPIEYLSLQHMLRGS